MRSNAVQEDRLRVRSNVLYVFDTSVLVAGVRSRNGASFALLEMIGRGEIELCLSNSLYFEWQDVLSRPEHLPPDARASDAKAFVAALASRATWQHIYLLLRPVDRDPDDAHVLELAFAASATIVTHNPRDFAGAGRVGIEVLSPRDLLKRLRES